MHGILNAVSWGILIPLGAIIARYVKVFEVADPAWFYMHVSCQLAGYAIGVAGWATGLNLGKESKGITYTTHRSIGIAIFALATLQVKFLVFYLKKGNLIGEICFNTNIASIHLVPCVLMQHMIDKHHQIF